MKNLTCKQQADVSVQLVLQLMRNLTYEIFKGATSWFAHLEKSSLVFLKLVIYSLC